MVLGAQIPLAALLAGAASANPSAPTQSSTEIELSQNQLIRIFKAIESIPEGVLKKGDAAAHEWLKRRIGEDDLTIYLTADSVERDPLGFNAWHCGAAIGAALLSGAIPITKLTKLRSFLRGAGGAVTFARTFYSAFRAARQQGLAVRPAINRAVNQAASTAGPEVRDALLSIFMIDAVIVACTS